MRATRDGNVRPRHHSAVAVQSVPNRATSCVGLGTPTPALGADRSEGLVGPTSACNSGLFDFLEPRGSCQKGRTGVGEVA